MATIERANLYIDDKLAKGENVNIGAIYSSAFAGNWGTQYLQQKELQVKQAAKTTKSKSTPQKTQVEKELSNNKESLLQRWQDLSINEKQDYFKRALNNIPKVMKSIEQEKATIDNAMSRPLLRIELEKLLSTVAN